MPSFPVNIGFCTTATCWISRITNSEEGVVQCAPMVNVPHSLLNVYTHLFGISWFSANNSESIGHLICLFLALLHFSQKVWPHLILNTGVFNSSPQMGQSKCSLTGCTNLVGTSAFDSPIVTLELRFYVVYANRQ